MTITKNVGNSEKSKEESNKLLKLHHPEIIKGNIW